MSRNLLLILVAGVDLWAALYVTQIHQQRSNLEVSMAISDSSAPATVTSATPVQIWLKKDQIGLWPHTNHPMTIAQIHRHLRATAAQNGKRRLEVRLLCDLDLTIDQWGKVALEIAEFAEEITVAPLYVLKCK